MTAPSSKSMLVLAVLAVVLSASLLLVSIPGYDGEDGAGAAEDQTTMVWSEAQAVVFNGDEPIGYKTIQAAIAQCGLPADVRGEKLTLADFAALAAALDRAWD